MRKSYFTAGVACFIMLLTSIFVVSCTKENIDLSNGNDEEKGVMRSEVS